MHDFHREMRGEGDGRICGAGIYKDNFYILYCLLHDAYQESANVLFFVVAPDDNGT